jgi:hypothetical protein
MVEFEGSRSFCAAGDRITLSGWMIQALATPWCTGRRSTRTAQRWKGLRLCGSPTGKQVLDYDGHEIWCHHGKPVDSDDDEDDEDETT